MGEFDFADVTLLRYLRGTFGCCTFSSEWVQSEIAKSNSILKGS